MSIFKTRFLSLVALLFYLSTAASSYAQQTSLRFLAEDLPPYHFINSQGQATGALVEIVQAMLIQAKLPGTIEIQPFARSYQNSQNQKNTFLFSLLKTPNRLEKFQWVGQTYKSYAVMVGLKNCENLQLTALADAKKHIVGTIRGYHSAHFLHENGFEEDDNLSLSVTSKHLWAMLFSNRIDFVLTNYMALDRDITKAGFDANNIAPYLSLPNFPNELHIATGLSTPKATVKRLAKALSEIKKSGIYQTILTKYDL